MIKLPQKSHFKMDEACGVTGVKPYVLRFWETEFDEISPLTSSSGQKLFSYDDLEKILLIKRLLFEDKLTIEKAKEKLMLLAASQKEAELENKEDKSSEEPEFDLEKLILAKRQLQGVLEFTESLKQKHHWS